MARRIWGKRHAGNRKQQMGWLQKTAALVAVLAAGAAAAALLGGSSYAFELVTGGTTETTRSFQAAGPTISSDQDDYAPGSTVTLTGAGWGAGEAVHVFVNDDVGKTWSYDADVTADADGGFTLQFQLPQAFVATYAVRATGDSGAVATASFTDGAVRVRTAGITTAATVDWVKFNNTTCSGSSVGSGSVTAGTGGNGADIPIDVSSTESLRLTANAVSGAVFSNWSNGSFASTTSNPGCLTGGNNTQNTVANYTPITNRATTTAIARTTGSTPSVYGSALTLTASVTATGGNPSSVGTVTFKNGGTTICNAVPLSGNSATCSPSLGAGSYTLTAEYSGGLGGTVQFGASTSTGLGQTVSPRSITGNFTAQDKVYDATTGATIATRSLTGVLGSDSVSLSGGTASFGNKSVGTGKTVTGTGFTLAGTDAGNYTLGSTTLTTTANIAARNVSGHFAASSKTYDGTSGASITSRGLTGDVAGDNVTLTGGTATFANKNVGTGKTVTGTGFGLSGTDAANYSLAATTLTTTADITSATISGSFTASDKVYDGTTAASIANRSLSGAVSGDDVSLSGGTATFADKNVGAGKTVTGTGFTLAGGDAGNYSLASTTLTATARISVLTITASFTAASKEYDQTASATIATRSLVGAIAGDDVDLAGGSATFDNKNVGLGKIVSGTGFVLSGADAPNYSLYTSNLMATADITPKSVAGHFAAADKTYDATTAAAIETRTLSGTFGGDDVSLAGGTATFADKNVGSGKLVTGVGFSLSGSDAGNYNLSSSTLTTNATISAKDVDGHMTAADKVYDGTAQATIATRSLSDTFLGDSVFLDGGAATFADKNVGSGKEVTGTGFSLSGTDAGNYHLTSSTLTAAAEITPRPIEPQITVAGKTYDASTAATILTRTLSGTIAGDDVSLTGGNAEFVDKNVGTGKSVSGIGFTLSGGDAGNYELSPATAATTADISPLTISGSFTAGDKEYDGTTAATISGRFLTGTYFGDFVALAGGTATFDTKNAASGKTVTGTGFTLSGTDAGNYALDTSTLTTTAAITPRSLTASFTSQSREYDGSDNAAIVTRSLFGVLGSDDVELTGGVAHFSDANAGIGKIVTGTGFTLDGGDAGNYSLYTSTLVTSADITKAQLDVTADDVTRTYGNANPSFTATYSGFKNGETLATSGVGGDPSLTTTATPASDVGEYTISAALGSLAAGNYSFAFHEGTLTVAKAPLSITAADESRVYGDDNPALTGSIVGLKNGDGITASYSTAATAGSDAGSYAIEPAAVDSDPATLGNYDVSLTNGTLAITKAPLTVTAVNASREYGDPNPAFSANYSGFKLGQDLFTSGVGGEPSLTTTATPASDVGDYAITAGLGSLTAANYSFGFVDGTLSIGKAPLTVTAADTSRAYGDANPSFTASYSGFKNGQSLATSGVSGDPSLTTTATAASNVGDYAITAGVGSLSSVNYSFGVADGTLSIDRAPLTITAADKSKIYGDDNPTLTGSIVGLKNGDGITASYSTGATAASDVGDYAIVPAAVDASPAKLGNYDVTLDNGALTITKAPLSITAADQSKIYGDGNPPLTGSISGIRNGDGITASYATSATANSDVGTYAIMPAAVDSAPAKLADYDVTLHNGTLTITKAQLEITADDKSKVYGDANPAFTASFTGFKNGQNLASSGVSGSPNLTTDAAASSNVGSYAITAAAGNLAAGNYSFAFHNGTLAITRAQLDVTANDASRVYGDANPSFTASYSGFKLGQTLATSGVSGSPNLTTAATTASNVGAYVISAGAGSLDASNYGFAYHNGTLTITKAPLIVMADSKSKLLNAPNPPFTASYAGLKLGQTFGTSGVSGSPSLTTTAVQSSPAGAYQITAAIGTLSSGNYSLSFVNGVLTILYGTNGYLQPINDTAHTQLQMSVFKAGSTIPVKFQLLDANGAIVQSPATPIWVTPTVVGTTSAPVDETVYSDQPTSGSTFRWDGQEYIFNWQTPKNATGSVYRIGARLDDGTTLYVNIGLK